MLIEVKVKVARVIDGKTRRRTETFLIDKEFFSEAEYVVTQHLTLYQQNHSVESFEIQSLRISPIREVATDSIQLAVCTFIATLKDLFHTESGEEKWVRYKILIGADNLTQAHQTIQELARQGYDMQIEGIKQVDYEYLGEQSNQEETEDEQD